MIPHFTFYTQLDPEVSASTNGPFIRIRPDFKDDAGVLAHERVHVQQWYFWFCLSIYAALYMHFMDIDGWPMVIMLGAMLHNLLTFIPAYCLWKEVQAYREQAKHYPTDRRMEFAGYIATQYGLNISTEDAYQLLTKD